jgi:hypothetical protein
MIERGRSPLSELTPPLKQMNKGYIKCLSLRGGIGGETKKKKLYIMPLVFSYYLRYDNVFVARFDVR